MIETDDLRHYAIEVKPVGAACNLRCEYCYYLGRGTTPTPNPSPTLILQIEKRVLTIS